MSEKTVPAMRAPAPERDNPLTRSLAGIIGMITLAVLVLACVGSMPYTLGFFTDANTSPPYSDGDLNAFLLPPTWAPHDGEEQKRYDELGTNPFYLFGTDKLGRDVFIRCLAGGGISIGVGLAAAFIAVGIGTLYGSIAGYVGGRIDSAMMRIVDILYGLPYILLVVLLAVAGDALIDEWAYKKVARAEFIQQQAIDELARRGEENPSKEDATELLDTEPDFRAAVDEQLNMSPFFNRATENADPNADPIIYTKSELEALWFEERAPAWLVLRGEAPDIAAAKTQLASDNQLKSELHGVYKSLRKLHPRPLSEGQRKALEVAVLLIAIGGVSWLTMARVIRGQVLSLKERPFMEAARAMGVPVHTQFLRHLLPNLIGPIVVYATLTVPQAILQESFLSFLGIGVQAPLPSWGNLAAEGLSELNTVKVRWWLIVTPCALLGVTLLALNFVGEGLREAFDPKRARK